MKLWLALEGACESNFVKLLIQKEFPSISIKKDELEFIKSITRKNKANAYLVDYEGEGRIPYGINEDYERFLESNSENILIICDVETNLKTCEKRKEFITERLDDKVDKSKFLYVFSCPYIEEIYWDHPDDIREVLKTMYQKKFPNETLPQFIIPRRPNYQYKYRLKKLCEKHDLTYRNVQFSKLFFSNFQYQFSSNGTVQRLFSFLQNI